ncbi:MAG: tRNA (N6-threonylcarbamoyladenosine(37)-N6)-methyltransferase TrmO [bacterium]
MSEKFEIGSIGIIHTPFASASEAPIQGPHQPASEGRIEVFAEFADGLDDLDGFDCAWVVWYCHRAGRPSMKVVPYMDTEERGLFATRAPARPNPIALSVVGIVRREENVLVVSGVDMLDGTPLLDLKPYIPGVDSRPSCQKDGWIRGREMGRKGDDRFGA